MSPEALKAIGLARDIFPRLSFDLIYARPNQTLEAWESELEEAIGYAADHLSLYQLTIEEGTPFHALACGGQDSPFPMATTPPNSTRLTQEVTAARGLPAYEISNHARPGAESRHNLTYWRYGEYVGVGPGAHGRFVEERPPGRDRHRADAGDLAAIWSRRKATASPTAKLLSRSEEADEFLLMGLRLRKGSISTATSGWRADALASDRLSILQDEGIVAPVGNSRLRATPAGMIVLDAVVADLAR